MIAARHVIAIATLAACGGGTQPALSPEQLNAVMTDPDAFGKQPESGLKRDSPPARMRPDFANPASREGRTVR